MSVLTTAGKNQLLDKVDGDTGALTWYIAPFNGDPSGAGTEQSSNTTQGRVQLTSSNMAAAASGSVASSADLTWTNNSGSDITIDYFGFYDAASNGNLVAYDAITSMTRADGESVTVEAGDLTFSLTDS